jgi:hypothetical protein
VPAFLRIALPLALLLSTALLALVLGVAMPAPVVAALLNEGGLVETATVVVYAFAIVAIWFVRSPHFDRVSAVSSTVVLTACVAREISLRRWLIGVSDSSFCCASQVTAALGLIVLGALAAATAQLLRSHLADLWRGLRRKRPVAATLFALVCATAISQLFDRLPALYPGHTLPLRSALLALSFEETFEFLIPVLVIVAAFQARFATQSG